jgi:pyruvate dehydrogenase E2 component (dihydrolipoamide acetyltransferase)
MPKMSMTMETGELIGWRIAVGDAVREGQVVCEVLTDKVDMEVEAPSDGTVVDIEVTEGETVSVGTPLAWIETTSDSLLDDLLGAPAAGSPAPVVAAAAPESPAPAPAAAPEPATVPSSGIVLAMPAARRMATAADLDLSTLAGSGPDGAVMVSDVRSALEAGPRSPLAARPQNGRTVESTDDDLVGRRAEALAPRPGEGMSAPGAALWRDAVLGAGPAPETPVLLARAVAAIASALAGSGPPSVRPRPRVALLVPTAAGSVPVTFTSPHTRPADELLAEVSDALDQAHAGSLDVRFLAVPDATLTWLDQVDRVVMPVRPPALLAVGMGSAAPRVVATGNGVGVRTTVALSATADVRICDPGAVATLLARVAAALEAP